MKADFDTPGAGLARIPLARGELWLAERWLPPAQADALLADLLARVPWEVHRIRLFGRSVDSPRLSCWIGDPGAAYRYSGVRFAPHPWPPSLAALRAALAAATGTAFDSVLANRYRDGRDAMGWHSDDEPELGPEPVIASLSLGATRRFVLKARTPRGGDAIAGPAQAGEREEERVALDLPHGSLLVMRGATQRNYRHALPRTAKPVGERVNLTFRRIVRPAGD
jgi:alkylated DNA repair dioxygenase AlkB